MRHKNRVKTISKWICLLVGSMLLILVSWYIFFRLMSQLNATRRYEMPGQSVTFSRSEAGQLTIGNFNIAHGRGAATDATNWHRSKSELNARLEAIARQLREAQVDIVILNEIDFSAAWSYHLNQAEFLAKQAGYLFVAEQRNFDISFPFFTFQFGNAILSRYPLRDIQFMKFPPYARWEDIFAGNHDGFFGLVDTPFGPVGLLAIHLEYRSEAVRVQSVRQLIEWCQPLSFPIIAAGDFNSTPVGFPGSQQTSWGLNAMTLLFQEGGFTSDPRLSSDTRHFTFPSKQPKIIIDWVLGKGAISIVESTVIPSALSDHLMVTATVQMTGVTE